MSEEESIPIRKSTHASPKRVMRVAYRVTKNPSAVDKLLLATDHKSSRNMPSNDLRFDTYLPNPTMDRLKAERRECNICLTRSFNSSNSSFVHPSKVISSGRTANRRSGASSNTEERRWTNIGRVCFMSVSAVSPSSVSVLDSSRELGGERVYVGMRLTQLPKLGTNREFCTLVRVDKAATSGSAE